MVVSCFDVATRLAFAMIETYQTPGRASVRWRTRRSQLRFFRSSRTD
jgi:hypothetical protein